MERDRRIHVTLEDLRAFQGAGSGLSFLPDQPSRSALNGRHRSRLRGRGLNFEEMRDYLPGDDIRSIDWKATARTGTPHVRVFTEERDRPALLVVDQRMSMFYGSQLNMKSVTAAEAAAIAAYRILDAGDRVGGIAFNDDEQAELRPQRSVKAVHGFLGTVARMNGELHADRPVQPHQARMNDILRTVGRLARHDHLVLIYSDFSDIDEHTARHLRGIARHNDLILVLVIDPTAERLEPGVSSVIGDGTMQAELDLGTDELRRKVTEFSSKRLERIRHWQAEINLSVLPMSAGEETLPQVRQLLARTAPRRRVR